MASQSLASSSLSDQQSNPYLLYAISNRPPGSSGSDYGGGGGGGAHSRDPIQIICPHTGSNVTGAHPLRVPAASTKGGAFGVRCLQRVPLANMLGGGGDDINSSLFVGHGGAGSGGRDDHAFLLSAGSGNSGGGSTNPRWKVRLPETLSSTPQSLAVSPCGRYLAAGSINGTCFLWEWTNDEDNLVKVWKAHYRPVTCLAFDKDDGATLFTGGEDGVVNAWCLLDLVDNDGPESIHPFRTWSEHHLPVTSLCILPGSGRGSTRLVSSSLDRNLILMEVGGTSGSGNDNLMDGSGARTLARMCLPSGLHTVITDSSCRRLYGGGADGNIYCVDLCRHAIQETLGSAGTFVNVNQGVSSDAFLSQRGMGGGDFESLLSGSHLLSSTVASAASTGLSTDQGKYVSELKGHVKAVTSLALLDPADLASSSSSGGKTALLASGSNDGTLRIWDLHSRSCVKVLRPWSTSSEGKSLASASSASSCPPVTGIIAVPKSSLTSHGGSTLAMSSASSSIATVRSSSGGRRGNAQGDLASLFKPLKRFVRGTSVVNPDGNNGKSLSSLECTPLLWPRRDESYVRFWEEPNDTLPRKMARTSEDSGDGGGANDKAEIARLSKALAESQTVIERWQAVNNQLVSKLKTNPT